MYAFNRCVSIQCFIIGPRVWEACLSSGPTQGPRFFFFCKACGSSHSSPMRFDMSIPPSSKPIRSSPIETNSLWSFKTPMLPPKD